MCRFNPNLDGGVKFILPCWFSLNNSETLKAVVLLICNVQQLFVRDTRAKFGIPNLPQSLDIGQNSEGVISDFRISGQFLVNKNCYNSRTSNDKNMTLAP